MPVLPCEPVSARTVGDTASTTWRASAARAVTGSSTTTVGAAVGRLPRTAAAPAEAAAAAKSWPSTCSPAIATKSPPGTGCRVSTNAAPVTSVDGSPATSPRTTAAISASVIAIIAVPRPVAAVSAASSSRATCRSSKGCTVPATSCPVS